MSKVLFSVFLLAGTLMFSGCSSTMNDMSYPVQQLALGQQATEKACWEHNKGLNVDCAGLSDFNCLMLKTQVATMQGSALLVAAATGNSINPCSGGTNVFDVYKTEVQEKNATARSIGNGAFGLGKWIVGGVVAKAGIEKMGDSIQNNLENSQGSQAHVSASRVSEENTEVANALGEESQAKTGTDVPAIPTPLAPVEAVEAAVPAP